MSDLRLSRLDPDDDAEYAAFQRVYERAARYRTPHVTIYGGEESRPYFMPSPGGRRAIVLVAWVGEALVGQACAFCPPVGDPDPEAHCQVYVDPDHMGRGIGSRLVEGLLAVLRDEPLTHLSCDVSLPAGAGLDDGYVRFAERHGWRVGQIAVDRRLDLPIPDARLAALAAEAATHHAGYRLETVTGPVPAHLIDPFVSLVDLVSVEAPAGDLEINARHTGRAELAAQDQAMLDGGQLRIFTLAWSPEGEPVALTNLVVAGGGQAVARQGGTIVRRDHRGRRLGLAVKVANLAALQRHRPDVTCVVGDNAETNTHMAAVNERIGFVEVGRSVEMQARLPV